MCVLLHFVLASLVTRFSYRVAADSLLPAKMIAAALARLSKHGIVLPVSGSIAEWGGKPHAAVY